jgi:hypothetical protein
MAGADEFLTKLAEARRLLLQIPGVLGVGYGYKERGGQLTTETSFRVYVDQKKPTAALAPEHVIPDQVLGIKTDVIKIPEGKSFACEVTDIYPTLVGGITISNLRSWSTNISAYGGTLGAFLVLGNTPGPDNIGAITNQHVLADGGGAVGNDVYQPDTTKMRQNKPDTWHKIGTIHSLGKRAPHSYIYPGEAPATALPYHVDCAVVRIDTCHSSWCKANLGTKFSNKITTLAVGGKDALEGTARISHANVPVGSAYPVYKVGRKTGRTVGTVADAMGSMRETDTNLQRDNIIIVHNTGPNCGGAALFADESDSGAVLVNDDRKVVGLVWAGNPTASPSLGFACHIDPVLDAVGATLLSTQNAAAAGAVDAALDAPGLLDEPGEDVVRALALRHQILASERGRLLRTLAEKHRHEVMRLVNHHRPVTVAWHRLRGPDYLGHILHASRHANHPVPHAFDGVERSAALDQLLALFERHGSSELRDDIGRHAGDVRALLDGVDDLEALAARLEG